MLLNVTAIVKIPTKAGNCGMNYVAGIDGHEVKFYKQLLPSNKRNLSFLTLHQFVSILPKANENTRPRYNGILYFKADRTEFCLQ